VLLNDETDSTVFAFTALILIVIYLSNVRLWEGLIGDKVISNKSAKN